MIEHRLSIGLSVWLKCLGFLEVGFINGLVIAIKSFNATSTERNLIAKFVKPLMIKRNAMLQGVFKKNLKKMVDKHDIKTIAASMELQGLVAKPALKFKCTIDSKHRVPVTPNLLEQDFIATAPNQKWAGNITCLATSEGWMHLAIVIDLCLRQVIFNISKLIIIEQ